MRRLNRRLGTLVALGASLACGGDGPSGPSGPAVASLIAGDGQSALPGAVLPAPLVVKVADARGTPWPGRSVTFVVTSGGGRMATSSVITGADGTARDHWTLGTSTLETQSVEIRLAEPKTGATQTVGTVTARFVVGPPASVVLLRGAGQAAVAGEALPDSIAVRVLDANGVPVPGATVAFAAAVGGGSVAPATAQTDVLGRAATRVVVGAATVRQSVTATVAGASALAVPVARTRVATKVTVSGQPVGVAISPANVAYVSRLHEDKLSRFAPPSTTAVGEVTVGRLPSDVRFNSAGTKAYVANQGHGGIGAMGIGVVNVATGAQEALIGVGTPLRVLPSPDDRWLYVLDGNYHIAKVDLATGAEVGRASIGAAGNGMAITRDGSRLYVSNRERLEVREVDAASLATLRTWTAEGFTQEVVLSPDESEVYAVTESGELLAFARVSGQPLANVAIGGSGPSATSGGYGMALSPDGTELWITLPLGGAVAIVDRATKTVIERLNVGGRPRRIAFAADGTALIANQDGWVTFVK